MTPQHRTIEERVARLESRAVIGIVIALLLGATGGYLAKKVQDVDARATEALVLHRTTSAEQIEKVVDAATATVTGTAEAAARAEVAKHVPLQTAAGNAALLEQLRREIPNAIAVSPAGSIATGGGYGSAVCGTGIASGVSSTAPPAVVVSCSSLSLRRQ